MANITCFTETLQYTILCCKNGPKYAKGFKLRDGFITCAT